MTEHNRGPSRRRDPYLDRMAAMAEAIVRALEGETSRLPGLALELERQGFGAAELLLAKLQARFARKAPPA